MSLIKNKLIGAGEVVQDAINNGELLKAPSQNAVFDALALKINSSLIGANSGVASLDSGGKVPVAQLPNSVMEFQGAWNASTNSPTLADGTGNAGDVYRVSVAGSQNLGSGSISFSVGDWAMYNGSIWQQSPGSDSVTSVNGATGVVVLDSDDIAEGSTNLYYTAARFNSAFAAKSTTDLAEGTNLYYTAGRFNTAFAAKSTDDLAEGSTNKYYVVATARSDLIASSIVDGDLTHSPDGNSVFDALALKQDIATALKPKKESFTLSAGDITNQYVDLLQVIKADSLLFVFSGVVMKEGSDYTVSLTGGAGGKTRVTFAGDIATAGAAALVATDVIDLQYLYA